MGIIHIILYQMDDQRRVVIAVPRQSPIVKIIQPVQEKRTDFEEIVGDSLKMLGSSLGNGLGLRKNSAFSLYEVQHSINDDYNIHLHQNYSESLPHPPFHEANKQLRKWKKAPRSKREMNRLQTKNLNRYFRSKMNEMLRDIRENPINESEAEKAEEMLNLLNKSNNIMFSELREIMKDQWLHKKLTRCSGILLKYIHKGKMGTYSKMIMLKYYNKIMKAIRNPDNFSFWK